MKFLGLKIKLLKFPKRERRKWQRTRVYETLYLDYRSDYPPVKGSAEGRDISLGGVRFVTQYKIPKGTPVQLTLRFASSPTTTKSLSVRARILRCSKKFGQKRYRVGCEFLKLDETSYSEIETFVKWVKEQQDKYLHYRYGDV